MKIAGEYTFDAPRALVWEALLDPSVLTRVLPGCEKLERLGANEYEGALDIKVGPVQGKFQGKILLEDMREPEGYTMHVDGRGAAGFVKAKAALTLAEQGGQTLMAYDSDAQVGGRIASVGQRLLDSSAKAVIKQSLEGLNGLLKARAAAAVATAAGEAPPPEPEIAPPSQAEFAANVAKEVAKDLVPPKARPVIVALIVILLLLLAYALLD